MPTEIEHIEPYSTVRAHDFDNLVLLCLAHHREVTSGRLSKRMVRQARERPYSSRRDDARYRPELGNQVSVNFGSTELVSKVGRTFYPFSFFGLRPIRITVLDKLVVNLHLFDRSGRLAVSIVENVFTFTPSSLWDVRLSGTNLRVKYGLSTTLLSVKIEESAIAFNSVRLAVNKVPLVVDREGMFLPNEKSRLRFGKIDASALDNMTFFAFGQPYQSSILNVSVGSSPIDQEAWDLANTSPRKH
jgi:hypothetical protein